ncbi:hypothetical protein [Serratia fonticola]|uniref:hypothetical protein n=1 Tax=Serratia fonticola TaxID=47917 RepID=UPI00093C613F|nr:hypothetical protein [Serratia fonticola]MDQ7209427.1 hypothetical protein [Serratia fonticola]OKP31328.1 hypothetical protein BSQ40_00230 [Serratia fonticola]HBE9082236.1 hypothetical protein [Serratia fonticola]HBE9092726.1 hypothetical protein [Serratia fonticola]
MQLIDAQCRAEQARAVLDMWLEAEILDHSESALVCALITILDGVPESIRDHINSLPAMGAK